MSKVRYTFSFQTFYALKPTHRIIIVPYLIFSIAIYFTFISPCYAEKAWGDFGTKEVLKQDACSLSISNGLLSLDAQDADVRKLLEAISTRTGIKIETNSHVKGKISISFHDISLEEALKKIGLNHGIVFKRKRGENTYHISRVEIFPGATQKYRSRNKENPSPQKIFKPPPRDSLKHVSQSKKPDPQQTHTRSLTIQDQMTSITSRVVSNELIARFKEELGPDEIQALISDAGATIKTHIKALNYYLISLPPSLSIVEALRFFQRHAAVEHVEPNLLIPVKAVPNDPEFSTQWSLHNTGQTGGADDADIDAVEAWDIEQGTTQVVIAIIDTGVDYTHEDLAANIWQNPGEIPDNGIDDDANGYIDDTMGWDFVDSFGGAVGEDFEIPDNDPMDRHGHGTHVAGIAGAVTNNSLGIAGVTWNCTIMPVRAGYKDQSGGGILESDDAAQAIVYAAENGAQVINLSWGDYQTSNLIRDAMAFATTRGALICAAAGNENSSDRIYPAASENDAVLAVGALDNKDKKSSFSNYGDWVHVSAPGAGIYSTHLNNSYRFMSGTSMAAPHVAGVAALLFSFFPDLSPLEIKSRIMRSVDMLPDLAGKSITSGRINAHTALSGMYETPHIFSLSPDAAHRGDQITLLGDCLGSEQGSGYVSFQPGINASIISWSDTSIQCTVPESAQTGAVTVTTSEGTSNGIEITILTKLYDELVIENAFLGVGQALGWRADDQSWLYELPFTFTFFGQQYNTVYVSSNGYLDFTNSTSSYMNSTEILKQRCMIAPLWDDIITNGTFQEGEDIYIHSPSPDSVCIRWIGERYETGDPVNVEVILYENGRIIFNYGPGNINLSPTIGISGGDGNKYRLSSYDGNTQLNQVQSILFTPCGDNGHSFTIPLDVGWNLISLPLAPDTSSISQIIGSASEGIESIWGYNAGTWQVYIPSSPQMSNLEAMKTGYGYWVKTNQEGLSIQIQGELKTTPLALANGWNLIGINSLQSMAIEDALSDIEGEYESVWGYKDGVWQTYNPQNPGFSDLEEIEPGMGYWVKVVY